VPCSGGERGRSAAAERGRDRKEIHLDIEISEKKSNPCIVHVLLINELCSIVEQGRKRG
jgi:hypothetical protein